MKRIAQRTDAYCKLSGLVTEAAPQWTTASLQPYVDVLIDAFGPKRLMWGSDWPVLHEAYGADCSSASPYASWYDTAAMLISRLSSDERESIFGRTASMFYGVA